MGPQSNDTNTNAMISRVSTSPVRLSHNFSRRLKTLRGHVRVHRQMVDKRPREKVLSHIRQHVSRQGAKPL
ncbi:hypothetical protein J2Z31_002648 [Sinorhizobium kostiense]|uniref:Transposase n=1 Tax=Sinorhizobium kostiense TaxID=76747 RepID=A0ABS4R0C3_9HYPH|nr:hypothetical protein [Sinorhizobium kostiense]